MFNVSIVHQKDILDRIVKIYFTCLFSGLTTDLWKHLVERRIFCSAIYTARKPQIKRVLCENFCVVGASHLGTAFGGIFRIICSIFCKTFINIFIRKIWNVWVAGEFQYSDWRTWHIIFSKGTVTQDKWFLFWMPSSPPQPQEFHIKFK